MGKRVLNLLFYFGLFILTIGTLFKIQHWPYGSIVQSIGVVLEFLFFMFVNVEIIVSAKATITLKIIFASLYIIFPILSFLYLPALILIFGVFISGTIYLNHLRKKFLFVKNR